MQLTEEIYRVIYQSVDRLGVVLDAALIVYLINHYFVVRGKKQPGWLWYVASTLLLTVEIFLVGYGQSFFRFVSGIFLGLLVYALLFFRGALYWKLSISCIYCTLYFVTDSIYMPWYNLLLDTLGEEPYLLGLGMICFRRVLCKGIMYLLSKYLLRNAMKEEAVVPPSFVACIYVFCGFDIAILLLDIFYLQAGNGVPPLFSSLFMAVCFALILSFFYLFTTMVHSYQENISDRLRVKEEELHEQYLEQTGELIQVSRQFRHDMKAHIFCMQGLLEQKQYQELGEYLQQFGSSKFLHLPIVTYCANDSINTILNQNVHQGQEEGIPVKVEVTISNQLTVEKLDLCTIISNLCDNALEAVHVMQEQTILQNELSQQPDRQREDGQKFAGQDVWVKVTLQESKGYLTLKVTNPIHEDVLSQNPSMRTTKADKDSHGLGMQIVRDIVDKYHGMMDVTSKNGEFCCFCLLENG